MIAGIAGALSLVGTVVGMVGTMQQYSAQQKAEELRKKQMELEASRARREQVRRSQVARASATASATNQGAQFTSALAGGQAQVQNESGRNIVAINQDEGISNGLFKANQAYARGGMISAMGSGISSLGSAFSSGSGTMQRLSYGS